MNTSIRSSLLFALILLSLLPSCGSNRILPPCIGCGVTTKGFVYTADAAGNPSTVSALVANGTTGTLSGVAGSPYNAGSGSYALAVASAQFLYVANLFSGDISAFSMNQGTGALSPVLGSPFSVEPGIDAIVVDPTGKFLYASSQSSANLYAFSINPTGTLTPLSINPTVVGSGMMQSRSLAIDATGKYLYVIVADSFSANIYGFSRDTMNGTVTPLAVSSVPVHSQGNRSIFEPTGHFLLVTGTSVFGLTGGIDIFALNSATGSLTATTGSPVQAGGDPGAIATDHSSHYVYVANTADATISAFAFDSAIGSLSPVAGSPFPSGGKGSINGPLGIATDDQNKFVFVCNASNDISVFSVGNGGGLTPVAGSPFAAGGSGPHAIVYVP